MNKEHYYRLLENPKLLSKDSLADLEQLVSSYPYVENFRILYALNLLILDDYRYQKNLYKAAFHSSDRKKLKYWVDYMLQNEEKQQENERPKEYPAEEKTDPISRVQEESTKATIETVNKDTLTKTDTVKEEKLEDPSKKEIPKPITQTHLKRVKKEVQEDKTIESEKNQIDLSEEKKKHQASKSKSELLQLVKKRLAEIEVEKQAEQEEKSDITEAQKPEILKAQLIDRFIEDQPSISRPDKNNFHNPHKDAVDSTVDEDDFFVTETLAQIHKQQGNLNKAIEIYQKLILKNPEKSTYFAAQIQELSKNN